MTDDDHASGSPDPGAGESGPRSSLTRNVPLRFVTAASLFDGHDATINIVRRLLMTRGAEVIHLGHNRSVDEIVLATLDEDAHGIAMTCYQGGHMESFKYMVDRLSELGAGHVKVFGGGGGVITPDEITELQAYGVTRIFSPEDGQTMGLHGMIASMVEQFDDAPTTIPLADLQVLRDGKDIVRSRTLARLITALENGSASSLLVTDLRRAAAACAVPVLGVTGTGGAGKSSLIDELVRRVRLDQNDALSIALISIDPTRSKFHGALLGDRIRMNAIGPWNGRTRVFMRSMATRGASSEVSGALPDAIAACKLAGFDLVIVETSGIGQGDSAIAPLCDLSLYVMTPEFGAASQLEKIDMLDHADFVVINKFDRRGAPDALHDVSKQYRNSRELWAMPLDAVPVYGTQASRFDDDGVTALYQALLPKLGELGLRVEKSRLPATNARCSTVDDALIPSGRSRYLADIGDVVRDYHRFVAEEVRIARERQHLAEASRILREHESGTSNRDSSDAASGLLAGLADDRHQQLDESSKRLLASWRSVRATFEPGSESQPDGTQSGVARTRTTLSGTVVKRVTLPDFEDDGEALRWLLLENAPGSFPYTAGVFAFKRDEEEPTRMFAGEGDPFRTNRRFKLLASGMPGVRLSTAFDSATLYGEDPAHSPDVYGRVGNSGVSVATLDDMKALYDGFDLCDPLTSVSMTINGPAPTILAMFFNAAIDQRIDRFRKESGREPSSDEYGELSSWVLSNVRGTVQADILKEDQGQNTCIFTTDFSLRLMADVQEYFVRRGIHNFYSASVSGYHIAEAGANPITQLAFTLANGFTYVEAYLARGMHIDDFAPSLSFFFSSGMDPEYSVLGRVARRIWAVAMKHHYGASERSQKLKYHVQTSGRSLHAQEMDFNDIRTTLQALSASYDNCNSLHTNAYDEAVTTPSEESVRRALAIQLIINREWGLSTCENANQGSFVIEELTRLVEDAVLCEFDRIADRGGVLGAMETGYQRQRIQDESMRYEQLKHEGRLPIVGVNTFRNPREDQTRHELRLARATDDEKRSQLRRLADFQGRHAESSPKALARLRHAATNRENIFDVLMDAVRVCSLGQISAALFEVGGKYRRNM